MRKLMLVASLVLGLGACGEGGMEDAPEVDGKDAGVSANVAADALPAPACSRYECQFRCDDGGTTNGNSLGPWNGCYCIGYKCIERGFGSCSPHVAGCVVLSPGVLDAGLP